jgi:hypothetical protein
MNGVRVGGDDRPRIVVCGDKMRSVMANDANGNGFMSAPTIGTISRFDTTYQESEANQTWKTGDEYVDQSIAFNRPISDNFHKAYHIFMNADYPEASIPTLEITAARQSPSNKRAVLTASNMSYSMGLSSNTSSRERPDYLLFGPAETLYPLNDTGYLVTRTTFPSNKAMYCSPSSGIASALPDTDLIYLWSQTDSFYFNLGDYVDKEVGTDGYNPDVDIHISVNYMIDFELKNGAYLQPTNKVFLFPDQSLDNNLVPNHTIGMTYGSNSSERLYLQEQIVVPDCMEGRAKLYPHTYCASSITNDSGLNHVPDDTNKAHALLHFDMVAKNVSGGGYIRSILPYVAVDTQNWFNTNSNSSVKIKLRYSWLAYAVAHQPDGDTEGNNRKFGIIYDNDAFRRPEHHTVSATSMGEHVDFIEYGNLVIGLHGYLQSGVTFSVYTKDDVQTQIRVSSIEILNDACPTSTYDFSTFGFIGQHSIIPTTPEAPYQHSPGSTVHNSGLRIYTYTSQVLQAGSTVAAHRAKLFSDIKIRYNGGRLYHLRVIKEPDTSTDAVHFRYWTVYADPKLEDPPSSTT